MGNISLIVAVVLLMATGCRLKLQMIFLKRLNGFSECRKTRVVLETLIVFHGHAEGTERY